MAAGPLAKQSPAPIRPRTAIIVAAVSVFVLSHWVPFGDLALYPLTLFTTWVHEMGHGLTALVLGGRFDYLEIDKNAGGLAYAFAGRGWGDALVAAGGLLAPPIIGTIILSTVHGPRRARFALGFLAAALVLSLVIWVRSATGYIAMPIVAALLGWAAWPGFRERPERRVILAQVLAVILASDTVTRMVGYALSSEADPGERSDVKGIADNLGGHYLLWGLAIIVIALGLLAFGLWWAWRRPDPAAKPVRR